MRPAAIEIVAVAGLSTVQDRGRPGWMHAGVPPGGALVPELAARANRVAGNSADAPLLETFGRLSLRAVGAEVVLGGDDGATRSLAPGGSFDVVPSPGLRVRYLAVRGGLDVPPALGGRGTLLVAGLGGHRGRALAKGDRVPVGHEPRPVASDASPPAFDPVAPVRVVAGPDLARFPDDAIARFSARTYEVLPASDRTGSRLRILDTMAPYPPLRGLPLDVGGSAPMVRGAIQIPASGEPVVLGPDHPTTGGYPVLAVLARADLGRFFARPIGATVRFVMVSLDEARALVHA